jgi:hypothetical protein
MAKISMPASTGVRSSFQHAPVCPYLCTSRVTRHVTSRHAFDDRIAAVTLTLKSRRQRRIVRAGPRRWHAARLRRIARARRVFAGTLQQRRDAHAVSCTAAPATALRIYRSQRGGVWRRALPRHSHGGRGTAHDNRCMQYLRFRCADRCHRAHASGSSAARHTL